MSNNSTIRINYIRSLTGQPHFVDDLLEGPALDKKGFERQVGSVSELQSGSFPVTLKRIWLSGYYGVGTPGGGALYRDSDDTTTADNGGTVLVDADGVRWKRPDKGHVDVAEFGAKGDGAAAEQSFFQAAIDAAPDGTTVYVPALDGNFLLADRIFVSNRNNLTIEMGLGANFTVSDGAWTAITIDASNEIPDKRAMIALVDCTNCLVRGGRFDGAGFAHITGEDACGVLNLRGNRCRVTGVSVLNVNPNDSFGPINEEVGGVTVWHRYNGIIAIKSSDTTVDNCYCENITYDAITCRVACSRTKFLHNTCTNALEGLQATTRYGQADASDPDDRFNNDVVMANNTMFGFGAPGAPIVTHAFHTVIEGNNVSEFERHGISVRLNADKSLVTGNTISGDDGTPSEIAATDRRGVNLSNISEVIVNGNSIEYCRKGIQKETGCIGTTTSDNNIRYCTFGYLDDFPSATTEGDGSVSDNFFYQIWDTGIALATSNMNVSGNTLIGDNSVSVAGIAVDHNQNGGVSGVILNHNSIIQYGAGDTYVLNDSGVDLWPVEDKLYWLRSQNTAHTITDTESTIPWDVDLEKPAFLLTSFNGTTGVFTTPSDGVWQITYTLRLSGAVGDRAILSRILINDVNGPAFTWKELADDEAHLLQGTVITSLDSGDEIEITGWTLSGNNTDVNTSSNAIYNNLMISRVG